MSHKLLEVKNLKTIFYTENAIFHAVNDVSFDIIKGQTLGMAGESGCGKSVTALSIMGLIQPPSGKIEDGEIIFQGQNLLNLSNQQMCKIRGKEISMIFQEPMTSLNPVFTIGEQIAEVYIAHFQVSKKEAKNLAINMLGKVGIPLPEKRYSDYPHHFSGGMRQRVMIAMALACEPKLLICDEPTTALDVTIQAQILDLMKKLQQDFGTSILFISHDLGVLSEMCDEIMILYAGSVVERAKTNLIYEDPWHPYTKALLKSIPHLGSKSLGDLDTIPGIVPDLSKINNCCTFSDRCTSGQDKCKNEIPLSEKLENREVCCFFPNKELHK